MTGNVVHSLRTWSAGESGEVREFHDLPESNRAEFRAHLDSLAGRRVLIVTRRWQEDTGPEQSVTEVIADATPVYVANMLDSWAMTVSNVPTPELHRWDVDSVDAEHYYRDGADEYYGTGVRDGVAVPVPIRAEYSARLCGFRPRELAAIYNATRRTSPLTR